MDDTTNGSSSSAAAADAADSAASALFASVVDALVDMPLSAPHPLQQPQPTTTGRTAAPLLLPAGAAARTPAVKLTLRPASAGTTTATPASATPASAHDPSSAAPPPPAAASTSDAQPAASATTAAATPAPAKRPSITSPTSADAELPKLKKLKLTAKGTVETIDADSSDIAMRDASQTPVRAAASSASASSTAPAASATPAAATPATPATHTLKGFFSKIMHLLLDVKDKATSTRSLAASFMQPPDKKTYPDYYEMIERPIAFDKVQTKVDASRYSTMDAFKKDVSLIFRNCQRYNQPESQIYQDAAELEAAFTAMVEKMAGEVPTPAARLSKTRRQSDKLEPSEPASRAPDHASDVKRVQRLADAVRANINQLYPVSMFDAKFTWAAIHAAAYYGNLKVVETLVEYGANVELEDTWYRGRPLAWAAFAGHLKMCKLLVEQFRVNVNAVNKYGQIAFELLGDQVDDPVWINLIGSDAAKAALKAKTPAKAAAAAGAGDHAKGAHATPLTTPQATHLSASQLIANQQQQQQQRLQQQAVGLQTPGAAVLATPLSGRGGRGSTVRSAKRETGVADIASPFASPPAPAYAAYATKATAAVGAPGAMAPQRGLVSSIGIVANDNNYRMVIPFSPEDPSRGLVGQCLSVGADVKSLNIRVVLTANAFDHVGAIGGASALWAQTFMPRIVMEPLKFQDAFAAIHDGVNAFEIIVSATPVGGGSDGLDEVHQTVLLAIHRA
ncbi:hypothetical protein BC831DRAFT_546952 [Entophlyctis helioformis]|nr:hypothetical protein BC831DRAFT_546952 [Entophlyctis helioformis]